MRISEEKQKRLAYVARQYYLEGRKQSDIAKELGVSRPLISRMLSEAKNYGVVEITIHEPENSQENLLSRLCEISSIKGGFLVEDGENDYLTNRFLSQGAINLIEQLGTRKLGIGWGHFVGQLVERLEESPRLDSTVKEVCPLVGNASIPIRNYQSNENVRLIAQQLGATPHFLYLPALPESLEEKQVLCSTELYKQIYHQWQRIDTAFVNIGNYPSTPDFASVARYGNRLHQQKACGRMLAYYFNPEGSIIQSEQDFAIQIPLEVLRDCPNVVGVCSANTSTKAFLGALRTGYFTHVVVRSQLVREFF